MWKTLWKTWTVDKPAALGDWLWDAFVVQLAALLDRLTKRQVVALVLAVVLIIAYDHRVPLPPALLLVGDLIAYVDIFAMILLLSMLSRVATILLVIRQLSAWIARSAGKLMSAARRLDFRHRRERGSRVRKRLFGRSGNDDKPAVAAGLAWA